MHPLEQEIQYIVEQCTLGNISNEETVYLLNEIKEIRAAQECAGNEVMCRHLVECCNIALKLV